jgi:hypothetical protein
MGAACCTGASAVRVAPHPQKQVLNMRARVLSPPLFSLSLSLSLSVSLSLVRAVSLSLARSLGRLSLSHADMHYRGRRLRTSLATSKRAPTRQRMIPGLVCSCSRLPVRFATRRAARHSYPSLSLPAVLMPVSARARSVPACCADLSLSCSLSV